MAERDRGRHLRLGRHPHPLARRGLPRRVAGARPGRTTYAVAGRRPPRPRRAPAPRRRRHLGAQPRPPAERDHRRPLHRGRARPRPRPARGLLRVLGAAHAHRPRGAADVGGAARRGLKVGVLSNTIWPREWHVGFFERDGVYDLSTATSTPARSRGRSRRRRPSGRRWTPSGVSDPAACVYVGDRLFDDVWGAHNAGLRAIHVPLSRRSRPTRSATPRASRTPRSRPCARSRTSSAGSTPPEEGRPRRPERGTSATSCVAGTCKWIRLSHRADRMHDCACRSTTPTGWATQGDADQPHERSASSAFGRDLGTFPMAEAAGRFPVSGHGASAEDVPSGLVELGSSRPRLGGLAELEAPHRRPRRLGERPLAHGSRRLRDQREQHLDAGGLEVRRGTLDLRRAEQRAVEVVRRLGGDGSPPASRTMSCSWSRRARWRR